MRSVPDGGCRTSLLKWYLIVCYAKQHGRKGLYSTSQHLNLQRDKSSHENLCGELNILSGSESLPSFSFPFCYGHFLCILSMAVLSQNELKSTKWVKVWQNELKSTHCSTGVATCNNNFIHCSCPGKHIIVQMDSTGECNVPLDQEEDSVSQWMKKALVTDYFKLSWIKKKRSLTLANSSLQKNNNLLLKSSTL